jgi:ABC-2 type transport system permease protein
VTNLLRSEFRKIFTVSTWWVVGLVFLLVVGVTLAFNITVTSAVVGEPQVLNRLGSRLATNLYTSGQNWGTPLVMLLGGLIAANEYHHQTATPTFLATPRRQYVIVSKLLTALLLGAGFGLIATVTSVVVGSLWLSSKGLDTHLGEPAVLGALALNLLAFGIWGIFGVGLGTLLKNQIATVIMVFVLTFIVEAAAKQAVIFAWGAFGWDWVEYVYYALPTGASGVMTSAVDFVTLVNAATNSAQPGWYVGALVLTAWGALACLIGTLLTNRRDIT